MSGEIILSRSIDALAVLVERLVAAVERLTSSRETGVTRTESLAACLSCSTFGSHTTREHERACNDAALAAEIGRRAQGRPMTAEELAVFAEASAVAMSRSVGGGGATLVTRDTGRTVVVDAAAVSTASAVR